MKSDARLKIKTMMAQLPLTPCDKKNKTNFLLQLHVLCNEASLRGCLFGKMLNEELDIAGTGDNKFKESESALVCYIFAAVCL